jgi:hypothetical protein
MLSDYCGKLYHVYAQNQLLLALRLPQGNFIEACIAALVCIAQSMGTRQRNYMILDKGFSMFLCCLQSVGKDKRTTEPLF